MNVEKRSVLPQRPHDPLAPAVAEVIAEILEAGDTVTPLDVLMRLEIVEADQVERWRRGELPYLERGIRAGLSRVARLLVVIQDQALARELEPVTGRYSRRAKGKKVALRFSKRGDLESERAYSTHYTRVKRNPPGSSSAPSTAEDG